MKKEFVLNIPNSRLECKNYTLFETKMSKINNALFLTKTAKTLHSLWPTYLYGPYKIVPHRGRIEGYCSLSVSLVVISTGLGLSDVVWTN